MTTWLVAAFASLVLVLGFVRDPAGALGAYLAAYALAASAVLGALTLAMIGRLTGAGWYRSTARTTAEALAGTTPLLLVLFLPIAFGLRQLYPWATHADPARAAFLNPAFFLVRSALYLVAWSALAVLLPRWPRPVSAVGLPLVGLTSSFAAFDWFMSLEPAWCSSVYGVYVWTGGVQAALALVLLGPGGRARGGRADVAALLLTASIFWAYLSFSQALIIDIAAIPRETVWYAARTRGGWSVVLAALVLARFLVPFLALLPFEWKRRRRVQVAVSAVVLAGHAIDAHWLVLPALRGAFAPTVVDLAALLALGSFLRGAAEGAGEVALA